MSILNNPRIMRLPATQREWTAVMLELDKHVTVKDYNLEVRNGNVPGHALISIRGHDPTVPSGGPFGLSPQFGVNSYVFNQSAIDRTAGTPAAVKVSSTSANDALAGPGTGAQTVRIAGLDAAGNAQTADENMTGQTAVTTGETWSAVFSVTVLTTGSGDVNAGTIYVGTGTVTSGVPAVRMLSMEIGSNLSLSGYYVVPLKKTLYIKHFIATVATTTKEVEIFISTSADGDQWAVQLPFGTSAGNFVTEVISPPGFPAGTHIKLTATGSAASTDVTAILSCEVVDN